VAPASDADPAPATTNGDFVRVRQVTDVEMAVTPGPEDRRAT
jgi:hypothetical protein